MVCWYSLLQNEKLLCCLSEQWIFRWDCTSMHCVHRSSTYCIRPSLQIQQKYPFSQVVKRLHLLPPSRSGEDIATHVYMPAKVVYYTWSTNMTILLLLSKSSPNKKTLQFVFHIILLYDMINTEAIFYFHIFHVNGIQKKSKSSTKLRNARRTLSFPFPLKT